MPVEVSTPTNQLEGTVVNDILPWHMISPVRLALVALDMIHGLKYRRLNISHIISDHFLHPERGPKRGSDMRGMARALV